MALPSLPLSCIRPSFFFLFFSISLVFLCASIPPVGAEVLFVGVGPSCHYLEARSPTDRATLFTATSPLCLDGINNVIHHGDMVVLLEGDYTGPESNLLTMYRADNPYRDTLLGEPAADATRFIAQEGTVVVLPGIDFGLSDCEVSFINIIVRSGNNGFIQFYAEEGTSGNVTINLIGCSILSRAPGAALDIGHRGHKIINIENCFIYSTNGYGLHLNPDSVQLRISRSYIYSAHGEMFTIDWQAVQVNAVLFNSVLVASKGGNYYTYLPGSTVAISNCLITLHEVSEMWKIGENMDFGIVNSVITSSNGTTPQLVVEPSRESTYRFTNQTRLLTPNTNDEVFANFTSLPASAPTKSISLGDIGDFHPWVKPLGSNITAYELHVDVQSLLGVDMFGYERSLPDTIGPFQLNEQGEFLVGTSLIQFWPSPVRTWLGTTNIMAFAPSYLQYDRIWEYELGGKSVSHTGDNEFLESHNWNIAIDQLHCLGDLDFDGKEDFAIVSSGLLYVLSSETTIPHQVNSPVVRSSAAIDVQANGRSAVIILHDNMMVSMLQVATGDLSKSTIVPLVTQAENTGLVGLFVDFLDDLNGDGVKEIGVLCEGLLVTLYSAPPVGKVLSYPAYTINVSNHVKPVNRTSFVGLSNRRIMMMNDEPVVPFDLDIDLAVTLNPFVEVFLYPEDSFESATSFPSNGGQIVLDAQDHVLVPAEDISSICFSALPSLRCNVRVPMEPRPIQSASPFTKIVGVTRRDFDRSGTEQLWMQFQIGPEQIDILPLTLESVPLEPYFDYSVLEQEFVGVNTTFDVDVVVTTGISFDGSVVSVGSNVTVGNSLSTFNSTITIQEGASLTIEGEVNVVDTVIVLGVDSTTDAPLFTIGGCPQFTNSEFIIDRNSTEGETEFSVPLFSSPAGGDCPDTDVQVSLLEDNDKYCSETSWSGSTLSALFLAQDSCLDSSPTPGSSSTNDSESVATFFGKDWLIGELIGLVIGVVAFLAILVVTVIFLTPLRQKVFKFRTKARFELQSQ